MTSLLLAGLLSYAASMVWSHLDWNAPLTLRFLLLFSLGLALGCLALRVAFGCWLRWHGLDQWPTPGGRYYQRWMSTETHDDYYPWLANEKHGAEPWATWAQMQRAFRAPWPEADFQADAATKLCGPL